MHPVIKRELEERIGKHPRGYQECSSNDRRVGLLIVNNKSDKLHSNKAVIGVPSLVAMGERCVDIACYQNPKLVIDPQTHFRVMCFSAATVREERAMANIMKRHFFTGDALPTLILEAFSELHRNIYRLPAYTIYKPTTFISFLSTLYKCQHVFNAPLCISDSKSCVLFSQKPLFTCERFAGRGRYIIYAASVTREQDGTLVAALYQESSRGYTLVKGNQCYLQKVLLPRQYCIAPKSRPLSSHHMGR